MAKDGIAIIVNPNNPVADLSVEQIAQLATGEITELGRHGRHGRPGGLHGP